MTRRVLFLCAALLSLPLLFSCKGPAQVASARENNYTVAAANGFAFRFLQKVNAEAPEDYVVSPVSLEYLLGLLLDGAQGKTAEEIETMLSGRPFMDSSLALEIANAIIVNRNYPLLDSYRKTVQKNWQAYVRNMDFSRQQEVLRAINGWCDKQTHGLIPQILDEVSDDMMAVLMNAVYFKQNWCDPFSKERTREETFTSENGKQSTIPMMTDKRSYAYLETGEFQMVQIPYDRNGISMNVLLPKKGYRTDDILKEMTAEKWNALCDSLRMEQVKLYLPRFETKTHLRLNEMLSALGMPTAFSGNADFKAMFRTPAFVSLIQQDAFIRVDEEGTEAAAVTSAVMKVTCCMPAEPKVFRADHTFLFLISDRNGTILFAGRR